MVAAALRHGLAGDKGIKLCKGRVPALHHSDVVPGGALPLSKKVQVSLGNTGKCSAGVASGLLPSPCRSSSVATSRWSPSS